MKYVVPFPQALAKKLNVPVPRSCSFVDGDFFCPSAAVEGSDFCAVHRDRFEGSDGKDEKKAPPVLDLTEGGCPTGFSCC